MEDRYARHRLIDWWDQPRLASAQIMVAGAGAIGNEVVKLLALLGVGHIFIVDFDTVEISNLTRSVLFRAEDVGQSKAMVAAERARALNPDIKVRAVQGDLETDVGLGVYRAMDVVIGCLDSIRARLALNRLCLRAGVPSLNGGIEATLAEVSLYGEASACFECGMSDAMWEREAQRYSCTGLQNDLPEDKMPTTAVVASLCASYLVNEALYLLHREKDTPKQGLNFGQKLFITVRPYGFHITDLPRNPGCLAHDLWQPVEVWAQKPGELTVARLLQQAGMPNGIVELGFDLLTTMTCVTCGETEEIFQPLETSPATLAFCPVCQTESRQPDTQNWADAASDLGGRTLQQIGSSDYSVLVVKENEARRFIQLGGAFSF